MSTRSTRFLDLGTAKLGVSGLKVRGRESKGEPGDAPMELRLLRLGLAGFAAFGSIELANAVGTKFKNAMAHTVLFVFTCADGTLHHHMRTLRQSPAVLGQSRTEQDNAVPFGVALPFPVGVLPRLLRRYRECDDQFAAGRVMDVCFAAGEADDRELVDYVECKLA